MSRKAYVVALAFGALLVVSALAYFVRQNLQSSNEPLFAVSVNGKWGYIDSQGSVLISPQFDGAFTSYDGYGLVLIGERCSFVDRKGRLITHPKFVPCGGFTEALALVGFPEGGRIKYGFIDRAGRTVIPPKFDRARPFSEGLAAVQVKREWGYIDKLGNVRIDFQFAGAGEFTEGLAAVDLVGQQDFGYIDETGRLVIPARFANGGTFSGGLAPISLERKWGYIDKMGEIVIHTQFDYAHPFSEGLAAVRVGKNWGFINKKSEFVIPPRFGCGDFTQPGPFKEGLACVAVCQEKMAHWERTWKYGYIDQTGKMVIDPLFTSCGDFYTGVAAVALGDSLKDRKIGYINRKGEYIWNPQN